MSARAAVIASTTLPKSTTSPPSQMLKVMTRTSTGAGCWARAAGAAASASSSASTDSAARRRRGRRTGDCDRTAAAGPAPAALADERLRALDACHARRLEAAGTLAVAPRPGDGLHGLGATAHRVPSRAPGRLHGIGLIVRRRARQRLARLHLGARRLGRLDELAEVLAERFGDRLEILDRSFGALLHHRTSYPPPGGMSFREEDTPSRGPARAPPGHRRPARRRR